MVLADLPTDSGEPLILDSLVTSILPAARRADLQLQRSFNELGVWDGIPGQWLGDSDQRITQCRDVTARMRFEG